MDYSHANSLKDRSGKWTHWENAVYEPRQFELVKKKLISTYLVLKQTGRSITASKFVIDGIDFCEYGNSMPFRITIVDVNTGQYDFFYVKPGDASRIYGLELEHLLTDYPIHFLFHKNTLVEENIKGTPGDIFLGQNHELTKSEKVGIARAFVQFNEHCFARLLGDMRSYNFVVNSTSPTGGNEYTIRAIDFDQQCYEGRKKLYLPQFYKENSEYVELVLQNLSPAEIEETRRGECIKMAARISTCESRIRDLFDSMMKDDISENYKIQLLRAELNEHFQTTRFSACNSMGAIVKQQLTLSLQVAPYPANPG